jgi:hypothetical protein
MTRSTKFAMVLLSLFGLPFALFGLFALSQTFKIATGESTTANSSLALPLIFGVVFSGIGFGLIFLAFFGAKRAQRQNRLQVEHPAEPWLWREDWAQGRIKSQTKTNAIASWLFAIFWNIVSFPVAFLSGPQILKQKNPAGLIFMIFPAVGVYLLIRAIRQTIALYEFGNTWFEMSSVPGVIGRDLTGHIQARFPHSPDHGIHLRLSSVHRVTTNDGRSSSTYETILWRDEADLSSSQLYPGPAGTTIPVTFHIPLDAQSTDSRNVRDQFVWMLEALADVPGVDYHDIFEVPVFRTQQTPAQDEAGAGKFTASAPAHPIAQPGVMTVSVTRNASGTEFYFPAARNKSFATVTTVFFVVFGAAAYFLLRHAPFIFPVVFGFMSLVLLYISLRMWLETTRVGIGSGLTVQSGWLGGGSTRNFALSEVASISDRITAQQGGASGTPYYDIELRLTDGRKITLGHTLRNKQETEWIVEEMRRLAGIVPKSMAAKMV